MGGYTGKAVVIPEGDGCADVYVWHDGNFPINSNDEPLRNPVLLHHCDGRQFIEFGQFLAGVTDEAAAR